MYFFVVLISDNSVGFSALIKYTSASILPLSTPTKLEDSTSKYVGCSKISAEF